MKLFMGKVYSKLYWGNSFILLSNDTLHLTFKREKNNWMFLINSWLQSCWVAKQCSHSFLYTVGFENCCGMSDHIHTDNPHQSFSKPDEMVLLWLQRVLNTDRQCINSHQCVGIRAHDKCAAINIHHIGPINNISSCIFLLQDQMLLVWLQGQVFL